jgi:hypothetical protein
VLLVRPSRIASGLRPFDTAAKEIHMNAIQHSPAARLADLSPFDITVEAREPLPRVRNAVCGEFHPGPASDSAYGCVDWYQYRPVEELRAQQQRKSG